MPNSTKKSATFLLFILLAYIVTDLVAADDSTTTVGPTGTTLSGKKKAIKKFKSGVKKIMLKFVFLGRSRTYAIQIDEQFRHVALTEGVFVEVTCPNVTAENHAKSSWYFNGQKIEQYFGDWRVQTGEHTNGTLLISPVLPDDSGNYECYLDGQHKGIMSLEIQGLKDALLSGYMNYLIVSSISFGFIVILGLYMIFAPSK